MSLDDHTIVLYRQDGGWVAELPSLPGAYALMPTREEALAELRDVFAMIAQDLAPTSESATPRPR